MKSMRLHFGSTEMEYWPELRREAEEENGAFLFRSGFTKEKVYCILLTLPGESVLAEERLCSAGLVLEDFPNAAGLTGVPSKRIAELRNEAAEARRQGEELTRQLQALAEKLSGDALAVIGDGKVEIQLGRAVGARTVGMATDEQARRGVNPAKRARLIRAGADVICGDFTESAALLRFLGLATNER